MTKKPPDSHQLSSGFSLVIFVLILLLFTH